MDPRRHGTSFAAGIHTLPPGSAVPIHRRQFHDSWWVVLKGQGRLTVESRASTVVPGAAIFVPRQTWHGMRNTGTGLLQLAWVGAPAGSEDFFRELSQLGSTADASAIQAVAARHGIELRPEGAPAQPPAPGLPAGAGEGRGGRRRHRRGRRGRRLAPQAAPQSSPQAVQPTPPVQATAPSPPVPSQPSGKPQRHGRRHRRGGGRPSPHPQPQTTPSTSSVASPPPRPQRPRHPQWRKRFGRVKEVYMGGRWVRVSGEGPVIASEHQETEEGRGS